MKNSNKTYKVETNLKDCKICLYWQFDKYPIGWHCIKNKENDDCNCSYYSLNDIKLLN